MVIQAARPFAVSMSMHMSVPVVILWINIPLVGNMKKQWKLTAAILYGGVMMYGTASAGASGIESGNCPWSSCGSTFHWWASPWTESLGVRACNGLPDSIQRPGGLNHHLNEKVARLLGITPVQLEKELGQGKSLAILFPI
jgi:hypothetical protein